MFGECEFCIPLKRQTSAFGLVRGRFEKSALQVAASTLDLKISDKTWLSSLRERARGWQGITMMDRDLRDGRGMRASCAGGFSEGCLWYW